MSNEPKNWIYLSLFLLSKLKFYSDFSMISSENFALAPSKRHTATPNTFHPIIANKVHYPPVPGSPAQTDHHLDKTRKKSIDFTKVRPKTTNDNGHDQNTVMGKNTSNNESDSWIYGLFTHLTQIRNLSLLVIVATVALLWSLSMFGIAQITHVTLAQDIQC